MRICTRAYGGSRNPPGRWRPRSYMDPHHRVELSKRPVPNRMSLSPPSPHASGTDVFRRAGASFLLALGKARSAARRGGALYRRDRSQDSGRQSHCLGSRRRSRSGPSRQGGTANRRFPSWAASRWRDRPEEIGGALLALVAAIDLPRIRGHFRQWMRSEKSCRPPAGPLRPAGRVRRADRFSSLRRRHLRHRRLPRRRWRLDALAGRCRCFRAPCPPGWNGTSGWSADR